MHVRILLQITADDGAASLTEEVTAFEKSAERPEDLGLSLAEGKAVTAAIQRQVVNAQVASWTERHRGCEACGVHRRSKSSSPVVFRTLYGDVPLTAGLVSLDAFARSKNATPSPPHRSHFQPWWCTPRVLLGCLAGVLPTTLGVVVGDVG